MMQAYLKKAIYFNERYKYSKAFGDAMLIVKACGSDEFYTYLYDKIQSSMCKNTHQVLTDVIENLTKLTPKKTNPERQLLRQAAQILLNTLKFISVNGYQQDQELNFETMAHEAQVMYCLHQGFDFLVKMQAVEQLIFSIELELDQATDQ